MRLEILDDFYAICQPEQSAVDISSYPWQSESLFALINTPYECTLILRQALAPDDVKRQDGFRCFRVADSMDFDVIGVIAGISKVLAAAEIPIFVVSTYDTDYVLVKQERLELVRIVLINAGYVWVN